MKKWFILNACTGCAAMFAQSCKKEEEAYEVSLWNEFNAGRFTYYIGTPGITAAVGNNPHGFERVKFNAIAQQAFGPDGKLPAGSTFPDGAVIVKEIFTDANGTIELYAVMKKNPSSPVAGSGYEWAEFAPDGKVAFST